jgi:hypothetical protein
MPIYGLDKNAQHSLSFWGVCDEDFSHGKSSSYYTVDVLPEENKN